MPNITQLEQDKTRLKAEAEAILTRANGRDLTDAERADVERKLTEGASLNAQIDRQRSDVALVDRVNQMAGGKAAASMTAADRAAASNGGARQSLGGQFVASDVFKWITDTKAGRPQIWQSPAAELQLAATLTEDPASGGALVEPQYQPGVVALPTGPIVMSQLFAPGQITSNALKYTREKVITNAAAPTAEGAVKPESAITFEQVTEPVHKIPTWLPVSEELLEDAPGVRSYIDSRLRQFVLLALDNQLLNGDGVGENFHGLLTRTDLTAPLPVGAMTSVDAIGAQIGAVEVASELPVDGIVLNPTDWLKMSMVKTSTGEYIGANPFDGAQRPTLWGRAVAQTPKMPLGTALVGAFRTGGGQLFTRGGIRVDASNSHADFFIRNLVAIRAEIRALLALYRPQAFGKVTGLNPVTP